jgi:tetratricopeptide (TPR) repeat protein
MPTDVKETGQFVAGGLPALIRDLVRQLASGRLEVDGPAGTRYIWFEAGQIRAVVSHREEEKLGKWLVLRGVLEENRMALSLLRQPEGVRFGAFLVQEGNLTVQVLERELEALSTGILSQMLLEPGTFTFRDDEKLPMDAASINVTTASLLAAAVRTMKSEETVKKLIPDLNKYIWTAQDPLLLHQQLHLTSQEGYLLSRIDGTSTGSQLQRVVPLPGGGFYRALAALLVAGVLEVRDTFAARPLQPTKVEAPPPVSQDALYTSQQQREYDEVVRLAGEIKHKDLYVRLETSPGATQDQIHSKYLELVKRYHPDRAREAHLGSLRKELAAIYSAVLEAYETLRNPEQRGRYEKGTLWPAAEEEKTKESSRDEARRHAVRAAVVDANINRAKELVRAGDIGQAVQMLDQAIHIKPRPDALLFLARLEFKNPMWSQRALDHLKHAVALAPDLTEAWLELANFWGKRNKTDNQIACLEKVLEYDPTNDDVLATLEALKKRKSTRKR